MSRDNARPVGTHGRETWMRQIAAGLAPVVMLVVATAADAAVSQTDTTSESARKPQETADDG